MLTQKELPAVLADFLAAQNRFDSAAFSATFAPDAIVHDEGKDYHGLLQIKEWNEATNTKYHTQMEPIKLTANGQETILTVLMSGSFPGSPVAANFCFIISDHKIKSLVIR